MVPTKHNFLNNIFKNPLSKWITYLVVFVFFMFIGAINSTKVEAATKVYIDGAYNSAQSRTYSWNGVDNDSVDFSVYVTTSSETNRMYVDYGSTTCYFGYDTTADYIDFVIHPGTSTGIKSCRNSKDETSTASHMYIHLYFRQGSVESETYKFDVGCSAWGSDEVPLTITIGGSGSAAFSATPAALYVDQNSGETKLYEDLTNKHIAPASNVMYFALAVAHRIYTGTPTAYLYSDTNASTEIGAFTCVKDNENFRPSGYASAYYCEIGIVAADGAKSFHIRSWYPNGSKTSAYASWNSGSFTVDSTYPSATVQLIGDGALANLWTKSQTFKANIDVTETNMDHLYVKEGTTNLINATGDVNQNIQFTTATPGEHTIVVEICDKAGNCIGGNFVMCWDNEAPVVSVVVSDGTKGANNERYVTANTITPTVSYSDNVGVASVSKSSHCTLSGDQLTIFGTNALTSFSPSASCTLSNIAVNFDAKTNIFVEVTDYAGNKTKVTKGFYRIDNSRKINITSFTMHGYGAKEVGWMGALSVTGGRLSPTYTITNGSYIDKDYMFLMDDTVNGPLWPSTDFIRARKGIIDLVPSGGYVSLDDNYGGIRTTEGWYGRLVDGETRKFLLELKNIYGQISSAYADLTFDLTAPTLSSFSASDGDLSNNDISPEIGFTNSLLLSYQISWTEKNLYAWKITDNNVQINFNTSLNGYLNSESEAHSLVAILYDKAGNYSNSRSYSIKYDKVTPTISTFTAVDGDLSNNSIDPDTAYTNSRKIGLTINASDSNIWKYKVLDGGYIITDLVTTKPNSSNLINSTVGEHTLTLLVYDKAGNSKRTTYKVVYVPTNLSQSEGGIAINSFSAADGDLTNNAITPAAGFTNSTTILYSASTVGTYAWKYRVQDSSTNIYNFSTEHINSKTDVLANTTIGEHALIFYLYDKAGNMKSEDYTIVYWPPQADGANGKLRIDGSGVSDGDLTNNAITPLSGFTNSRAVLIQLSVKGSYLWSYKITDGGSAIYNAETLPNGSVINLANTTIGEHTISMYVYDKAGNLVSVSHQIIYWPPNISDSDGGIRIYSFSAADGDLTNNAINPATGFTNSQAIVFSVSDSGTYLHKYEVLDGTNSIYDSAESPNAKLDQLYNGNIGKHTLSLRIYDKAGNRIIMTFDIIYWPPGTSGIDGIDNFDVVDGDLSNNAFTPLEGYTNSRTIKYSFTVSGQYLWQYKITDGESEIYHSVTSPSNQTDQLANSDNGVHNLRVYVYDYAGNCSTATDSIILDTIAPIVNMDVDQESKTAKVSFADENLLSNATYSSANFGSEFAYYMSESALSQSKLTSVPKIAANAGYAEGSDAPINLSGQSYYLYIFTKKLTRDKAGNKPVTSGDIIVYDSGISGYNGYTYGIKMNINTGDFSTGSTGIDKEKFDNDYAETGKDYIFDITIRDRILLITVRREKATEITSGVLFRLETLNNALANTGYRIISVDDGLTISYTSLSTGMYKVLISNMGNTQNEIMDMIVVDPKGVNQSA